jgi:hypothetical protein
MALAWDMRGRAILICLMLCAAAPATLIAGKADPAPYVWPWDEPGYVPDYRWQAPADFTGDFVGRFSWNPSEPSECWMRVGSTSRHDASTPALRLVYDVSHDHPSGMLWSSGIIPQLHHGPVDTREYVSTQLSAAGIQAWGFSPYLGTETLTYVVAVTGLELSEWEDMGGSPLFIEVHCADADVTVAHEAGSKELLHFREYSMQGTGASFSPSLGAAVQVQDEATAEFLTQEVLHFVQMDLSFGIHQGSLSIERPDAELLIDLADTDFVSLHGIGGPGSYRVETSRVSAGTVDLIGLFAGLDPVGHFDELVTPPAG